MQAERIVREMPTMVSLMQSTISESKLRVCAYARVSTETDTNLQLCYADISV